MLKNMINCVTMSYVTATSHQLEVGEVGGEYLGEKVAGELPPPEHQENQGDGGRPQQEAALPLSSPHQHHSSGQHQVPSSLSP